MGGAERVLLSLVQAAPAAGHTVAVAAAAGSLSQEVVCPTYPVPLLARRPTRLPQGILALNRAVQGFHPDLIHCHNPGMAVIGAPLCFGGHRIPGLVTVQGVPDQDYPATARLLRWARLPVVACGPGVTAGLADARLRVRATIGNGVAPAPPPLEDIAHQRAVWGLPTAGPLAISVGRLEPQKHHDLSIRALALVPELSLVILGEGPLRAPLETLARQLGVADRVALPGIRSDARAIVAAADVGILASRWEGLPLVGLEAAAAGTPLVATSVRGVREVFTDRRDALLVQPDDPAALASAVSLLLTDRSLARRLVTGGMTLASSYGEDEMVVGYERLYQELAAPPPPRRTRRVNWPVRSSRQARGSGDSSTGAGPSCG